MLNGDGRADLATPNEKIGNVGVLSRIASGNFIGQTYTVGNPVQPVVTSISRSAPTGGLESGNVVTYAVTFNESVTGVDASDFRVVSGGGASFAGPMVIGGGGASYSVTLNGIGGSGTVQLNLVDDDSIMAGAGNPLGGVGPSNGSFAGPRYTVVTTFPTVTSINRLNPVGSVTSVSSVSYAVVFSAPVTGVDPTDFVAVGTGASASGPISVSGSGSSYTVTVNGISGIGTLGLNLVDNSSIRDSAGNPLRVSGAPTYGNVQTFQTGSFTNGVSIADLNADGKADLIATNQGSGNISVLMGNGDGTFLPQLTYAAGSNPYSTSVADLNGDGKPDLVVADNDSSQGLYVMLGNGNGTFQASQTFAPGSRVVSLADLNGDGRIDIVAAGANATVAVLLGNGDGTFQAQTTLASVFAGTAVAAEDVNGDGKIDIIVASNVFGVDSASVLLGNGNGTFQAPLTYAIGTGTSVAVADFNGDGRFDIAISDYSGNDVGVP